MEEETSPLPIAVGQAVTFNPAKISAITPTRVIVNLSAGVRIGETLKLGGDTYKITGIDHGRLILKPKVES